MGRYVRTNIGTVGPTIPRPGLVQPTLAPISSPGAVSATMTENDVIRRFNYCWRNQSGRYNDRLCEPVCRSLFQQYGCRQPCDAQDGGRGMTYVYSNCLKDAMSAFAFFGGGYASHL